MSGENSDDTGKDESRPPVSRHERAERVDRSERGERSGHERVTERPAERADRSHERERRSGERQAREFARAVERGAVERGASERMERVTRPPDRRPTTAPPRAESGRSESVREPHAAEPTLPDLRPLVDFSLMDLATVWLILTGNSVIDWQRVDFRTLGETRAFLRAQAFDLANADDCERLDSIKAAAIDYLRRQFDFPIPRPIEHASVEELLVTASGKGHRQLAACVVLKAMHIIHHVEARELLYALPMSDQDVFRLVEEKVYRVLGHMLSAGQPITEFVSGRKRRDSIFTKLLSKSETHASAIYDKLRFRIVTRTPDDLLPVLLYLSHELFPFNYVVPHESINTLIQFRTACEELAPFKVLAKRFPSIDELTLSNNTFSSEAYRILHFVVDMPVRVPKNALLAAPPAVRSLGPVIFALCEFQMVDRVTEEANEGGEASHASYKERQRLAVMQRLKLGS